MLLKIATTLCAAVGIGKKRAMWACDKSTIPSH